MGPVKYILAVLLSIYCEASVAQTEHSLKEHKVSMEESMLSPANEFSSMFKWRDKLFLVPQYPNKHNSSIFYIDTSVVVRNLQWTKRKPAVTKLKFKNAIIRNLPTLYEGLEASAVIGDSVYFTLETEHPSPSCFLTKGKIWQDGSNRVFIEMHDSLFPIPKPKLFHNVGFESLSVFNDSLLAVFEYNKDTSLPTALLVDKSFTGYRRLYFDSSIMFRITDVAQKDATSFIAINFYYCDAACAKGVDKCEFHNYGIDSSYEMAKHQMNNMEPRDSSFSQILFLEVVGNRIFLKDSKLISYKSDNWEGIIPFAEGVLMVIDSPKNEIKSRLSYFKIE